MGLRGWLSASTVFFAVIVGGASAGWACSVPSSCDTIVETDGMPSCVRVLTGSCSPDATIDNRCDQAVEFVELDCGDSCADPLVFEPGEKGPLEFSSPDSENAEDSSYVALPVGWSLGQDEGLLDVQVVYEEDAPAGSCDETATCAVSGSSSVPVNLVGLGFVFVLVGWHRRRIAEAVAALANLHLPPRTD